MLKMNARKGRLLILAASLLGAFALGVGSMLAQTNSADGATPTDLWPSTLAAIISAKTAYAEAYPSPTVTATLTPDTAQTAVQETRNAQPIDSLELTATYIVGQATGTAMAIFGIPIETRTLLPLNTIVPTSTDTLAELERQKREYVSEMSMAVGFSHPIFDEIAQHLVDENRFNGRGHLQLDKRSTFFRKDRYVALTIHREGNDLFLEQSYLVLLRESDDGISLLDSNIGTYMSMVIDDYGFTDRNKNGFPDFTMYTWNGGKCCSPDLHIFEINTTRQIVEITPWTTDVYPTRFIDIDNDGIPEIEGESGTAGISTIFLTRWFGWNGQAYMDISSQHPELYLSNINIWAQQAISPSKCHNGLFEIEIDNYLINFYAMGRLSDGWTEFQRLMKLQCSAEDLKNAAGVLKEVEQWMNSLPKS